MIPLLLTLSIFVWFGIVHHNPIALIGGFAVLALYAIFKPVQW